MLADCITPYQFDSLDGPGCGQADHTASCLCDVAAPSVPATVMHLPCPQLVAEMLTGQVTPARFEAYMATVLGLYELASNILEGGITVDDLEEARSMFLDVWSSPRGDATVKLPLLREALMVYRDAGMTFRSIANHLRVDTPTGSSGGVGHAMSSCQPVTLVDIVRILNHGNETPEHCYKLALIEGHLKAGVESYAELVALTGLSTDQIAHFAQRWGYKTATAARMAAGGGVKNSVAVMDRVRELCGQGRKPKEILAVVHDELPESRDTLTYSLVAKTAQRMRDRADKENANA